MHYRDRERGISFVGLMFVLVVLGCGIGVGIKLYPIYMESYKIDKALEGVISDANVANLSKHAIQASLLKRLDIDMVMVIDHRNINDHVVIFSQKANVSIDVKYEEVMPLIGNISLLIEFDKHVEN